MEDLVARPPAHRVIPVLVDGLAVSDGQAKLPVLGEVMGYHLTFTEATDSEAPDFALVTVQARAHQNITPNSQGLRWDGTPYSYPPIWPTNRDGNGWAATWLADRPLEPVIEVRGWFTAAISWDSPTLVRGRVVAVSGRWAHLDLDDVSPPASNEF